jgi:hypothetical protein
MTLRTLASLLVLALPGIAAAQPAVVDDGRIPGGPDRSGWTVEASIGGGGLWQANGEVQTHAALSGINGSLGGFVTPSTALTLRMAGVAYLADDGGERESHSIGFFGPAIQHYVTDRLFLGGGVGIGVDGDSADDAGVAGDLRVGYNLVVGRYGGVHVALELTPAWFNNGGETVGVGVQVGAQLF